MFLSDANTSIICLVFGSVEDFPQSTVDDFYHYSAQILTSSVVSENQDSPGFHLSPPS